MNQIKFYNRIFAIFKLKLRFLTGQINPLRILKALQTIVVWQLLPLVDESWPKAVAFLT